MRSRQKLRTPRCERRAHASGLTRSRRYLSAPVGDRNKHRRAFEGGFGDRSRGARRCLVRRWRTSIFAEHVALVGVGSRRRHRPGPTRDHRLLISVISFQSLLVGVPLPSPAYQPLRSFDTKKSSFAKGRRPPTARPDAGAEPVESRSIGAGSHGDQTRSSCDAKPASSRCGGHFSPVLLRAMGSLAGSHRLEEAHAWSNA